MQELQRIERDVPTGFRVHYVEYGPDGLIDNNADVIRVFRVHDYLYIRDYEGYDKHLSDQLLHSCLTSLGYKSYADKVYKSLETYGDQYYQRLGYETGVADMPIACKCRSEEDESFIDTIWKFLLSFAFLLSLLRIFKRKRD
ncbi:endoribonuclease [Acrasis kona]|uniref:Endoribonuclease n=1 Tax=Acrasis kona TaxID=1008807 RepID=A0AAW2Z3F8_9EUKA